MSSKIDLQCLYKSFLPKVFFDKTTFFYVKMQIECNKSKYEEKPIKVIKLYFCKCSVTIMN